MLRSTKGTFTLVFALVIILLLVSPMVFAKWFATIDDEGLKSLRVRADIYKGSGGEASGQKHGRVQLMINEIEPKLYSYKFQIQLRKATPSTEYEIWAWATMPNLVFTIYGDHSGYWNQLEMYANVLKLDWDKNPNNGEITTSLATLKLNGFHEVDTGLRYTTDNRGTINEIKSGIITETNAMEYVLDLTWPIFKNMLGIPGLPDNVDFKYFGITAMKIHEGNYVVSGGLDLVGENPDDVFCTEEITLTYDTEGFYWEK